LDFCLHEFGTRPFFAAHEGLFSAMHRYNACNGSVDNSARLCDEQEAELGCPIRAVSIIASHQGAAIPSRLNGQALETFLDVNNSWPDLSGVSETGAVLVRPDGLVLWRCVDAADLVPEQCREEVASRVHAVNAASEATKPSHVSVTSDVHCVMTGFRTAVQTCVGKNTYWSSES